MKRYDRDEIQGYVYGSDLWAGLNDRILVQGVNDQQFWSDLFEGKGGKSFKKNLDCPENRETLIEKYQEINGDAPIVRSHLNELAYRLMISGNPCFAYIHLQPEAPADERPRDALGRIMSPKALLWRDFENWCNDPERKMSEIESLRRSNADFAEFYTTTAASQRINDDPMQDINVKLNMLTPSKKAVPADVLKFAQEYRTMSSAQVKTLLTPGLNQLGPAAAAEAKRLFDAACACGAI
jgi:hypothetical protein